MIGAGSHTANWLHADELGSVIATSNNSGLATIYTYGPYGEPNTWTGLRFRYTGQIMLPEAQLYHYKARVYDPRLGRFLQTDPVGYEDDLNLYAYVRNDPLNHTDPTGKQCGGAHDCPRTVSRETTRANDRAGGQTVTRTTTVVSQPNVGGPNATATAAGSIRLEPQATAGGAPAQVTPATEGRLLGLSESVGARVDVSSGVRSQAQQDALIAGANERAATQSQHTVGDAADISVVGMTNREVAAAAVATGDFERVNVYPNGGDVHVDQRDVGPGTQLYDNWRRVPPP